MSSGRDRDEFIDYLDDKSHNEEETLFLPAAEGRPDSWSVFYLGILTGIAGGGIMPLSFWLGGFLIMAGYFASALSFGRPHTKFGYALRLGFGISGLAGAFIFGGALLFPRALDQIFEAMSKRHLFFLTIALLPWAAAVLRYAYTLFAPTKRPAVRAPRPSRA